MLTKCLNLILLKENIYSNTLICAGQIFVKIVQKSIKMDFSIQFKILINYSHLNNLF